MKYLFSLILSLWSVLANAQIPQQNASKSFMLSEGKVYVVMAVVIVIVAGLLCYIINLDRKISKLEKTADDSEN